MKEDISTEQAIMEAAEREFLEKGFDRVKTTDIAKRAGVTHAMLHYYFRTKENLFDQVYRTKLNVMAESFTPLLAEDLPFFEKIRQGVEAHFDFIAANPGLPHFIVNEIIGNEQRRELCRTTMSPMITRVIGSLKTILDEEIAKGTIRPITPLDLILNIVSLNVFIFIAHPVISLQIGDNVEEYKRFLEHRKKENVRLVLKGLERE